jgi:hypothetical protein
MRLNGEFGLQELGTNQLVAEIRRRTAVRGEKQSGKTAAGARGGQLSWHCAGGMLRARSSSAAVVLSTEENGQLWKMDQTCS